MVMNPKVLDDGTQLKTPSDMQCNAHLPLPPQGQASAEAPAGLCSDCPRLTPSAGYVSRQSVRVRGRGKRGKASLQVTSQLSRQCGITS